ncbi:ABC transporter ATP-binding protein [Lentzea tibetensis]|uniref:ABC transporter ATP-binding protein n=1 Tax=Lentzea tibetensis TaxID=2591470 RepID=UPI001F2EF164|nr:ATP-binding cassette domain-containing protein [Lentzea tibetensis]
MTALVGPSGSGKTTAALRLVDATDARIGYLPQHPGSVLNPARRVGVTLRELERLHGGDAAEALARVQLPLDREQLRRFPHQFSGGQRQRIALAQVLTTRPEVLVLDEPSTGLDPANRKRLADELGELVQDGLAILLLSHDLELVHALADHVIVLRDGTVEREGPPSILEPRHVPRTTRPKPGPELLVVDGVGTAYSPEVDFVLPERGRVGVIGPSGSGKTTLARCIAGLHERYRGTIRLGDDVLTRQRSPLQRKRVQYVWQEVHASFDPRRIVLDQVARTAVRLCGAPESQARRQAVNTLERLGVAADTASRRPREVSGGELQRAALARALLAGPDVLVCDEITTALDDEATELVLRTLSEMDSALVWISHDLDVVAAVADHVVVLEEQ